MKIGIANLDYDTTGKVINAKFVPSIKRIHNDVINRLKEVKGSTDDQTIKSQAENLLSDYFNSINEIELADREKYKIVSTIKKCVKHLNGVVKRCEILFEFNLI